MCKRIIALTLSMLMLLCLLPAAVAEQDGWSVIGGICGTNWDTDFAMTKIDEDVWQSEPLDLHEGEMLKVWFGGSWDLNYGNDWNWDGGDPVVCAQDGRNLVIPADDTYTVTLTLSDPVTITLTNAVGETVLPLTEDDPEPFDPFTHSWSVIGNVFGTNWDTDFQMTETETGVWQSGPWALHAGEEFRVRADCDWEVWSYGTEDGDNCVVEEDGTYFITLDLNNDPIVVTWELTDQDPEEPVIVHQPDDPGELVWGVIGSICGTNWSTDFPMTEIETDVWASELLDMQENEELKVRFGCSWDLNYGIADDWDGSTQIKCSQDGMNLVIPADDTYVVTLYLSEPVIITLVNAAGNAVVPGGSTGGDPNPGDDPFHPRLDDEDIDPATAF